MGAEAADDLDCVSDVSEGDEAENHFSLFKAASQGPDALKFYQEGSSGKQPPLP